MEFLELTPEEYDLFAKNHPQANFLQSLPQYEMKKKAGYECYIVGAKENNEVIAASFLVGTSVLKIFRYFYAQRGILMDYENQELVTFFMKELKQFLKAKKALYLKFDPYVRYQEHDKNGDIVVDGFENKQVVTNLTQAGCLHGGFTTGFNDLSQVRWMMVLDLKEKTPDDLMQGMDQLRKRMIKKIDKGYVKVRELPLEELELFANIVNQTSERKGFYNRELAYYTSLYEGFGSDRVKVPLAYLDLPMYLKSLEEIKEKEAQKIAKLTTQLEKKPNEKIEKNIKAAEELVALNQERIEEAKTLQASYGDQLTLSTAFFIQYGDEVLYLAGGSYAEYNKFNGPYAIQWYMMNYGIEHQYARYNFYGTSGNFNQDASDYGVFTFKRGFNAVAEELVGDFYLPIRPTLFNLYNKKKHLV
ncbi:aminoacyltransferase [Isobaculum melis]|uniref:Peptidoglycan pentaglycine glycine transferase (The second and third glycine) n=1 Tax=Isobaculum melis TaxID=142588 RepID=A0A1H9QDV6_9LACT|nr:aminoacyltransferase [Isobaculum melis]SER58608.1 peptidoglycan pentaglycine glycine transferase (the second and third glycine) [Isobaculum melis]